MASRRQLKKISKRNTKRLALQKLKELQELEIEEEEIEKEIQRLKKVVEGKKTTLSQLKATLANLNSISLRAQDWRNVIDVSKEVGKKKYTEGQKNYIRALKIIENAISKTAADIKAIYGSDDIEELANQYYLPELSSYSQEELNEIEHEFNKTHGYHVRLENATNPFADIDFNTLMPN